MMITNLGDRFLRKMKEYGRVQFYLVILNLKVILKKRKRFLQDGDHFSKVMLYMALATARSAKSVLLGKVMKTYRHRKLTGLIL